MKTWWAWTAMLIVVGGLVITVGCAPVTQATTDGTITPTAATETFILQSSAFVSNGSLPATFTSEGDDISPPLNWSVPPLGTAEQVLTMIDANSGPILPVVHWTMYNIDPLRTDLPADIPSSAVLSFPVNALQGQNSAGTFGYVGPTSSLDLTSQFVFTLYALDSKLNLPPGAGYGTLINAMNGHILAQASLFASFTPQPDTSASPDTPGLFRIIPVQRSR